MACGAWDRCDVTPLNTAKYLMTMITALALNACGSPYYTSDPIEAWVVDADTGQPIEGAVVTANWQLVGFGFDTGGRKLGQLEVMEALTDKNGRFYFPGFTKLNPGLDDFSELDEVPLSSRKNDIATLHIGFWFSQFQRPIQRTERIHRNPVVAPNIDATEHGDDHRHIETSV